MHIPENESYWYAVYTKPRWEKKVARILTERGIEHYCPVQKVVKQWSDRKKVVLEPVFKSYLFLHISEDKKWEMKRIDGILNYVYWLGKPARIPEMQIRTVQKFLGEFSDVQVEQYDLRTTDLVRVGEGVLMNYEGMVMEVSGNKAKVRIESMGLVLTATFDKSKLEPIARKSDTPGI